MRNASPPVEREAPPVRRRWRLPGELVAALAVTAIAAAYFATFTSYGIYLEDEGNLLFQIARTFRGQLPYVDFHTGYTPGVFYLNAALFRLFGESVVPVRALLVPVNAATVGLIFLLARPLAGAALAAAVALGYAAFLPFFAGRFASFNIPYPSWYAILAWLGAQAAVDRYLSRGGRGALVLAGMLAGIAFSFKPNFGVLAILACGLSVALLAAGDGDRDRHSARLFLVLGAVAIIGTFWNALVDFASYEDLRVEFPLIATAPLALIAGRLLFARARVAGSTRLWPALLLVALGVAVPTAPWVAYFLARLGVGGFIHEVLLLGSDADRIYSLVYPLPFFDVQSWGPVLLAVALADLGLRAERGLLRPGPAVALAVLSASLLPFLVWRIARHEGAYFALVAQVEAPSFFLTPALAFAAVIAALRRLRGAEVSLGPDGRRLLGALVFALCMYMTLYPRVDLMHLIQAVPSMLVLAAAVAAHVGRAWAAALRIPPRRVLAAVGVLGVAFAALIALPRYDAFVMLGTSRLAFRQRTALLSHVAPVYVETTRALEIRALNGLLEYLRARLRPQEPVFGFPAMALVPFLLGHPTPTPHDYFFPGRPDHRAEAEIVRSLETTRPRYLVTLNRDLGFFSKAPAYYFLLRPYVRQQYVLEARFGRYDVFRRRDAGPSRAVTVMDAPESRRAAAAQLLARGGTPAGVAALLDSMKPDLEQRRHILRNLGELSDARAVGYLLDVFMSGPKQIRDDAAEALGLISLRVTSERYFLARDGERPDSLASGQPLPLELMRKWVGRSNYRRRIGLFAAQALADAGHQAAVPVLEVMLHREKKLLLRVAAANALVRLGRVHYVADLVALLDHQRHEVQDTVPSFIIETARQYPREVAAALEEGLTRGTPLGRETSAWIAGAARLPATAPALRRALDDRAVGVRIAAAWALGVLGDVEARPALERLAADVDNETRAFAREALDRLDAKAS